MIDERSVSNSLNRRKSHATRRSEVDRKQNSRFLSRNIYGCFILFTLSVIPAREGVAKGSEKKGTTKDTKSTKKSFSFPLWPSCSAWFKAFMLSATPSTESGAKGPDKEGNF